MNVDYTLFQVINNVAGINPVLDFVMITVTHFGVPILGILVLYGCKKKAWYKTGVAVLLVFVMDFLVKLFFFRQRPFSVYEVNLLVDHLQTASFPSRHTDLAFAVAQSIFFANRKQGVIAMIIAFWVGLSRIFVGVHYPSDVFVGALVGIVGAFAANKLVDCFWRK